MKYLIVLLILLFFNLQIPCVIVPIGQNVHQVRGLYNTITINPNNKDALRSELLQDTALVCILILLTCLFHRVRLFRGRIPCFIFCWSLCLCSKCFLLFLPFNVRKHLFRIIRSFLGFFDAKPLHICLKRTLQCTKKSLNIP